MSAKGGGERFFVDTPTDGEVAPIPVVRGATIEPPESTRSRHRMAVPAGKFCDRIVL
jgi:hypothetical protein